MRELNQSTAFGPFINRHHFAGYMELTIALPLGLLFAGAVDKEKRLIYLFIAGLMGVALVMTSFARRHHQSGCRDSVSRCSNGDLEKAERQTTQRNLIV